MTQVIIDDVIPRTQLLSAAGQTVFNTNWTADVATDILVYARAAGVPPNDVTQLVSAVNYNVTFIGGSQTVRVTFLSGRTLDDVITIVRNTPAERLNLYINTNFTPSMLNEDFGILTLVDQQAQMYDSVVNPGYNVSATIENIVDTVLPILGANQIWAMDSTRTGIIAYDVPSGGSLAPGDAPYLLQIANSDLPNAQSMGALASGFVVNTTLTGVQLSRVLTPVANQTAITNGSGIAGNPTIGIATNPTLPGTGYFIPPAGSTAQRPVSPSDGMVRYNTDSHALEVYENTFWDPLSGGVVDLVSGVTNEISVDNTDQANPIVGIADNPIIPGTGGITLPQGTTAQRAGSNGTIRFNSQTNVFEGTVDGIAWHTFSNSSGTVLSVSGTTNQIDSTGGINPILSLSSTANFPGTFNIQNTTAIVGIINDATMASATTSNISTSAALKSYIDSLVTGLNIQGSCVCASTTALTVTYNNGASGVGATLTNAGAQAVITLDGVSPTVSQRVLIKNQAAPAQNGIYTVTNVGSVSTNWILTRATDYDTAAEIQKGDLVILTGGTTQSQSSWVQTATVVTVGTDAITFIQFTASLPVNVPSGGTGVTSFTAYAPILGGITTTGNLQSMTLGASGTLFQSNGVGVLPGFTTTTYPSTNAINTIMYASSANVLGSITAANSSVLISSAGGVPSMSTTLPAGLTIPTPRINQINDASGNTMLVLASVGSAVNYLQFFNNATTGKPGFSALGADTDVGILMAAKAAGAFMFQTEATTNQYTFTSGTSAQHNSIFNFPSTSANRTITWPDASGTVAFTAGSGGLKSFQIFTSGTAATYTRPAGITSILVEVLGGGAGGGSAVASGAGTCGAAGGGGAGGYARLWVASAASSYTYTVGAVGNGGSSAAANPGSNGGTTTFSASSLQATGGVGGAGQTGSAGAGFVGSGAGGVGSNGDFNANGMPGLYSIQLAAGVAGLSGAGGSSIYGGGGQPTNIGAAGNNATNYGSGGSGGAAGTATNRAGGNGTAGLVIVWEFA